MRSVLAFAGFFLFLAYRIIMLPILSVLYALLALAVGYHYCRVALQQVPQVLLPVKNYWLHTRQVWRYVQKGAFSSLWHKAWAFSNHTH